jgi:methylthioribose-1-phosphate isomerase
MSNVCLPLRWENGALGLLDQRLLPGQEIFLTCRTLEEIHAAIRDMVVRGAPAIGFTALYGMALWLAGRETFRHAEWRAAGEYLKTARPTAVNLMYETDRTVAQALARFPEGTAAAEVHRHVLADAHEHVEALRAKNTFMAETALQELTGLYGDRPLTFMTHCNTGVLACGVMGTALGVVTHAHARGRVAMVYADETRPYMQGARLTAFELAKEGIPYHLVVEGAASWLLQHKQVDAIFVGADRIAANGDTANKVGTSTLAIVAKHYGVPFYVVAPLSSFDFNLASGKDIEIEMRHEDEILAWKEHRVAPVGARALNPSFDVTAAEHITGIICEGGIVRHPTTVTMARLRSPL